MRVEVGLNERVLVMEDRKPVRYLGPGVHRGVGLTLRKVELKRLDTDALTADLRAEELALVPATDYVEATAVEGTTVVRYVDGALEAVLGAGRHAAFTARRKVTLAVIDLRERLVQVTGQEVMTKDRVTLRLNLSAAYRVSDVRRLAKELEAYAELAGKVGQLHVVLGEGVLPQLQLKA
jgi:SPFH domain / Band 7 family